MQQTRTTRATVVVFASLLFTILALDINASPIESSNQDLTFNAFAQVNAQAFDHGSILYPLQKRAPISASADPATQGPTADPSTSQHAGTTTTIAATTTIATTTLPVTTTTLDTTSDLPTTTIITTTARATTTTTSETTPETTTSSSRNPKTSGGGGGHSGISGPSTISSTPNSTITSNSTIPPTSTPTNPSESSKVPILPIVLGSVLGLGALIGAGVFFFFRFRKNRRFDSKRPLSFLALSLEDPIPGSEANSSRVSGSGAIYDSNRPITSQPSLRYTPPVMSSRFSYQSSENSGATAGQYAQWSQDDENAALVGGPTRQQQLMMPDQADGYPARLPGGVFSQEHELVSDDGFQRGRPDSEQSFVASSMVPIAPNDPLTARYSRQQQQQPIVTETVVARQVGNPQLINPTEDVPLQTLNSNAGSRTPVQRPMSIHSNSGSIHGGSVLPAQQRPISARSNAGSVHEGYGAPAHARPLSVHSNTASIHEGTRSPMQRPLSIHSVTSPQPSTRILEQTPAGGAQQTGINENEGNEEGLQYL
ncbi:hypothetical protein BGZ46_005564 [Entomortierella lignicola]|nr:hypothetical protein BGZ46_005564 [Entomortierella lignicola]